jgi:hypothetical protein
MEVDAMTDKVLIFVPERRAWESRAEISRVTWIFKEEREWDTITTDDFVAKYGKDGYDTPEFRERLIADGYSGLATYRGLNKKELAIATKVIEGTVASHKHDEATP